MLSFLKKATKKGKDTAVSGAELFGQDSAAEQTKEVKLSLHFHPRWGQVDIEQKYIYQFLHKELPSLQENQISLSGIETKIEDGTYYVTAFLRNSIQKEIAFEKTTLLLLNKDGEVCARKTFDLSELGNIPANVNMPWTFVFEENTTTGATLSETDWQLAFELKTEHKLDLHPTWEAQLSEEKKAALEKIINDLPPLKEEEINFTGLQAMKQADGNLHVTILIRNGSTQNVKLEQLPLHVIDASGDTIAQGAFTLADFEVKANTTKPWSFMFPASFVTKEAIDLSTWKVVIPQN
ncbi:hypothetical protein BAMA_24310 [Bacillus manliponensis]|uniref:Accessory Sec system S-layer assembly protein n=1 Tax=Bacillus manliponensis TaxID=574376 RepID=A0A073JY34_9BACI|nr:accessory Sec system S-layer assembly protein [Bacillus manliponensis]KEK19137.1 hypothetical protein BAMA_24310 [Bacillus manliponensis]